jgi:hypothetical protein
VTEATAIGVADDGNARFAGVSRARGEGETGGSGGGEELSAVHGEWDKTLIAVLRKSAVILRGVPRGRRWGGTESKNL